VEGGTWEFNPDFRDLFLELNAGRVEYVIVGGYAVIYHADA
jgi:ABC-type amino acid transport substrate-binding protein